MSPELHKFLFEWLQWAEAGAQDDKFLPDCGLCRNIYRYYAYDSDVRDEFYNMITTEFPHTAFPFNPEVGSYRYEAATSSMYRNPQRLAWVRKVLQEDREPALTNSHNVSNKTTPS